MRSSCKKHGYLDAHIARLEHCPFCLLDQTMLDYGSLKEEVSQVTQSAINFHDAWSECKDALEVYQKALEDIIDVRLEPAYCYEQSAFMQKVAIKALDKVLVPTKRSATSCTAKKD